MNQEEIHELLYQALETEIGGVQVYQTAVQCAVNEDLSKEWQEYLKQTQRHEQILRQAFEKIGLDADTDTPGRKVVRHIGESLVKAMKMALAEGKPKAAELVAAECVVQAETKDHLNWELLGELATELKGADKSLKVALSEAHAEVEEEEDEHVYHTAGWARELWLRSLGLPAVLPPPEEAKHVKTAIGAARAKKARKELL